VVSHSIDSRCAATYNRSYAASSWAGSTVQNCRGKIAAKVRGGGMTATVAQMTKGELREMIEAPVERKLLELLGDPDEGLPIS
jgi:hypothetical protein